MREDSWLSPGVNKRKWDEGLCNTVRAPCVRAGALHRFGRLPRSSGHEKLVRQGNPVAGSHTDEGVVEVIFRVVDGAGSHRVSRSVPNEEVAARHFLQHVGEVLAAEHERPLIDDPVLAYDLVRNIASEFGLGTGHWGLEQRWRWRRPPGACCCRRRAALRRRRAFRIARLGRYGPCSRVTADATHGGGRHRCGASAAAIVGVNECGRSVPHARRGCIHISAAQGEGRCREFSMRLAEAQGVAECSSIASMSGALCRTGWSNVPSAPSFGRR